jgi:hypothetical protein
MALLMPSVMTHERCSQARTEGEDRMRDGTKPIGRQAVIVVAVIFLIGCTSTSPPLAMQPAAASAADAAPSDPPTELATAITPSAPPATSRDLPPTNLPQFRLECPTVPIYPHATRTQFENDGGVRRTAWYETNDTPDQVIGWFTQTLRAPEWSRLDTSEARLRYQHRVADAYNPGIGLIVEIEDMGAEPTVFRSILTIGHPHREDNWCPGLEP